MGLFNIFKKKKSTEINPNTSTDNGQYGPYYLQNNSKNFSNPKNLDSREWRRKIISKDGTEKFFIEYYGQLHPTFSNLITSTDNSAALVFAIEPNTKERILLFDGCKHGYNAQFCDNFTQDQIENRPLKKFNNGELLELTVSTYNSIDYNDEDEEFIESVDSEGFIELINGSKIKFEEAKANGFSGIQIIGTTETGDHVELVSEELS